MKQRRLSEIEKVELVTMWNSNQYGIKELSIYFNISNTSIIGLLNRRGFKMKSQSERQRKYSINENFFDTIDTSEKSYFLGILYADGYNNTIRYTVNLALKESDKEILDKLSALIQPSKPLQFINTKKQRERKGFENSQNQYRLVIANKHISNKLAELGCGKAKTFTIQFPSTDQVPLHLQRHFLRGYFDGDGHIGITKSKGRIDIVGTKLMCDSISELLKSELNINTYHRQRYPEKNNNIWSVAISGNNQIKLFCEYIYKESSLHMDRKYQKYLDILNIKSNKPIIKTTCTNCNGEFNLITKGLCNSCNYSLNNGKEKRRLRYELTGK